MNKNKVSKKLYLLLVFVFLIIISNFLIFADINDDIHGIVTDSQGKPYDTLMHLLRSSDKQYLTDVISNQNGEFIIGLLPDQTKLPDGKYYLQVYPRQASEDGFLHYFEFEIKNGLSKNGTLQVKMSKANIDGFVMSPLTGGPANHEYGVQIHQLIGAEEVFIAYEHVMSNGRYSFSNLKDGTYYLYCHPADFLNEMYETSRSAPIKIVNGKYSGPSLSLTPALKKGVLINVPTVKAIVNTSISKQYYVSPTGNDNTGNGSIKSPWKTIIKANKSLKAGDTLFLRGGTYRETLKPLSSGTKDKPITYSAYQNEKVIISGTDLLSNWKQWKGNIYTTKTNLSLGSFNQLLIGDQILWEARWPNLNQYSILELKNSMAIADDGNVTEVTDQSLKGLNANLKGSKIWIRAGRYSDGFGAWQPQTSVVKSFDKNTGKITFEQLFYVFDAVIPAKNNDFYLYGNLELLDEKNEWFVDESTKLVYLYSATGKAPVGVEMKKRRLGIDLAGVSFINIKGIQTSAATIDMHNANDCNLENLTIVWPNYNTLFDKNPEKQYEDGIIVSGNRNYFGNCVIGPTSGNGIIIEGNDNRIVNNLFNETNTSGAHESAAILLKGSRNLISHNTIANTGRFGIKLGGRENEIQYNDIEQFMVLSSDGAGIYGFCVDGQGTRIHHNKIHGATGYAMGIYLDNNSRNFVVDHNVLFDIMEIPFELNTPSNFNELYNNSFYNTAYDNKYPGWFWGAVPYHEEWFGNRIINNIFNVTIGRPNTHNEYVFQNNIESSYEENYSKPSSLDFSLLAASKAIDKGRFIEGITNEFVGKAPDIGAFESGILPWTAGCDLSKKMVIEYKHNLRIGINLLKNSGFDYFAVQNISGKYSTKLDNWTVKGSGIATIEKVDGGIFDWRKRGEPYRLLLRNGVVSVEQLVTGLKPNTEYELTGWTFVDEGETGYIGIKNFGGTDLSSSNTISTTNTKVTMKFRTGSVNTSALIVIGKSSLGKWGVHADDFGIVEVE